MRNGIKKYAQFDSFVPAGIGVNSDQYGFSPTIVTPASRIAITRISLNVNPNAQWIGVLEPKLTIQTDVINNVSNNASVLLNTFMPVPDSEVYYLVNAMSLGVVQLTLAANWAYVQPTTSPAPEIQIRVSIEYTELYDELP